MKNKNIRNFLLIAAVLLIIITIGYKPVLNANCEYYDIIFSQHSMFDLCKQSELNLIYFCITFGMILVLVFNLINKSKQTKLSDLNAINNYKPIILIASVCTIFYALTGQIVSILVELIIISLIAYIAVSKDYEESFFDYSTRLFILLLTCQLALLALYNIYTFIINILNLKLYISFELSTIKSLSYMLFMIVFIHTFKRKNLEQWVLRLQIFAPLSLIYLLSFKYTSTTQSMNVFCPPKYMLFCIMLILILIIYNITTHKKNIKLKKVTNLSLYITIGVVKLVNVSGLFYLPDIWHNGENVVPYQQIVHLGKKAYVDFFPTSGLYAMFKGFIMDVFFNNNYISTNYMITLTELIFVVITVVLLYYAFNKNSALFLIVLFMGPIIDRSMLILPFFLILQLKAIKKDEIVFLTTWILLCLLSVLHYPVYGAAFSLGTLPYAIIHVISLYKTIKNKRSIRHLKYKIAYLISVLIFFAYTSSTLYRELYSVLMFSEHTVEIFGVPVIGTVKNNVFINFINIAKFENVFYQIFIIFILVITPVSLFYVIILALKNKDIRKEIFIKESEKDLLNIVFALIFIIVSYSFTLVQVYEDSYLFRNKIIYSTSFLIIFYSLSKMIKNNKFEKNTGLLIMGLLMVISLTYNQPIITSKLVRTFDIENYEYIEETDLDIENLGYGFIDENDKSKLVNFNNIYEEFNTTIWSFDSEQGYYYILNKPVEFASAGIWPANDTSLQKLYFEKTDELPNVIIHNVIINNLINYYSYKEVMENGYVYAYKHNNLLLLSKKTFEDTYGFKPTNETSLELLSELNYAPSTSKNLLFHSWGKSYDSMKDVFSNEKTIVSFNESLIETNSFENTNNVLTIKDENPSFVFETNITDPFKNDFMYLDMDVLNNGQYAPCEIRIYFADDSMEFFDYKSIVFDYIGGELLIPMGSNPSWLVSDKINNFKIEIVGGETNSKVIVNKITFLDYRP